MFLCSFFCLLACDHASDKPTEIKVKVTVSTRRRPLWLDEFEPHVLILLDVACFLCVCVCE